MEDNKYKMTIDMKALKHLGINLYSNTPSVLSEIVANSWDADAKNVEITISQNPDKIQILDDGTGLSFDDINEKFLKIGYEKRKGKIEKTELGRHIMGRKGIGKLSMFSIANTVEVHTIKDGNRNAFKMSVQDIEESLESKKQIYSPKSIDPITSIEKGTMIILSNFRIELKRPQWIRRRLARRFTVISERFNVKINGSPITIEDRAYQNILEYAWYFGSNGKKSMPKTKSIKSSDLTHNITYKGEKYPIDGWIGTVKESTSLKGDDDDNINKIVVIVRGKVADENILDEINDGRLYTKYVIGEIHADFLDIGSEPDIATTSRQKINESDIRYIKLVNEIKLALKTIAKDWDKIRTKESQVEAFKHPGIRKWYENLLEGHKDAAKKLFAKINRLKIEGGEISKNELYVNGILAFEHLKFSNLLHKIEELDLTHSNEFKKVLLQYTDLEGSAFYQITKQRLGIINKLEKQKTKGVREKIIQKHIAENLWLLDPTWSFKSNSIIKEKKIAKLFKEITTSLTSEEKRARVDIKYETNGKKHMIIELKKPDRIVDPDKLLIQMKKYVEAVELVLEEQGRDDEVVEGICIHGRPLKGWNRSPKAKKGSIKLFRAINTRLLTYDELISSARNAYADYLESEQAVNRIFEYIKEIE